jgi:thiopurine S-methyltransferase
MRGSYASEVYGKLPPGCRGLLITLEYPQNEKAGPPFSVCETEIRALFGTSWKIELLERRDILEQQT